MKVVVIGSNGQLGRAVAEAFAEDGHDVRGLTHADIEIVSMDSVSACLGRIEPGVVINTAAMHHVEDCEAQPEKAYAVNGIGARHLALATHSLEIPLVHVSTDYVFDGTGGRPYVEEDAPFTLNVYGNTKLAGEYFVRTLNKKHFVLRTSALYGK